RAIRAFSLLLEYRGRYLILSARGRGYHVFVFAHEPRPVAEWTHLLEDVVSTIPTPIQDGECELFPSERTGTQKVGRPIRMPRTYNPKTDKTELIIAETIRPLLDRIERAKSSTLISNSFLPGQLIRDKETNSYSYSITLPNPEEKELKRERKWKSAKIGPFLSASTGTLIEKLLSKYPVKKTSTRNGILLKMAGELFVKFGWDLSKLIVEEHYRRNISNVGSPVDVHMRDFANMWSFILDQTISTFSPVERAIYDKLRTLPQREAFLLIRSFAHLHKGEDFPVAQASLADRTNVTQPGAKWSIERLIELVAIKKTADARVNSRPALYRWTANTDELPM